MTSPLIASPKISLVQHFLDISYPLHIYRNIEVKVTDEKGKPLVGEPLYLKVISSPKGSKQYKLFQNKLVTDKEGKVSFDFRFGTKAGDYTLLVCDINRESKNGTFPSLVITLKCYKESWILFLLFGLVGGLGLFLYGMEICKEALQKAAGNKLRDILTVLTKNPFLGILLGIVVTFLLQSSSASTVLLVGLVHAGFMSLEQTISVILGAGIGTTLTVQLIAFKITQFALFMIGFGFFISIVSSSSKYKYIGRIILGFGMIFYGMKVMSSAMSPLKTHQYFINLMNEFSARPFLGLVVATIFTAIIQGSAASFAIILTLVNQGLISFTASIPLLFGANIGTTATALLASLGTEIEGKRVAVAHLLIKTIGVLIIFPFFRWFGEMTLWITNLFGGSIERAVANAHTFFNVINAFMFVFFIKKYTRFIEWILPEKEEETGKFKVKYVDKSMLDTPSIALAQAQREILRMSDIVEEMLVKSLDVFLENNEELMLDITMMDDKVDYLEEEITRFLTNLAQKELTEDQSQREIFLLYVIDDLEHIGDLVVKNIMELARKYLENRWHFSEEGIKEIKKMHSRVIQNFRMAIDALLTNNVEMAQKVIKLSFAIYKMEKEMRMSHIVRLHKGLRESLETSAVHLDLINNLKRVNTHTTNIARAIVGEW
jgi:phosphate:Na+ symporter